MRHVYRKSISGDIGWSAKSSTIWLRTSKCCSTCRVHDAPYVLRWAIPLHFSKTRRWTAPVQMILVCRSREHRTVSRYLQMCFVFDFRRICRAVICLFAFPNLQFFSLPAADQDTMKPTYALSPRCAVKRDQLSTSGTKLPAWTAATFFNQIKLGKRLSAHVRLGLPSLQRALLSQQPPFPPLPITMSFEFQSNCRRPAFGAPHQPAPNRTDTHRRSTLRHSHAPTTYETYAVKCRH